MLSLLPAYIQWREDDLNRLRLFEPQGDAFPEDLTRTPGGVRGETDLFLHPNSIQRTMLRRKTLGAHTSEQAAKQGSLVRQTQYRGDLPREGCQSSIGEELVSRCKFADRSSFAWSLELGFIRGKVPKYAHWPTSRRLRLGRLWTDWNIRQSLCVIRCLVDAPKGFVPGDKQPRP